jgi:hypothetical protein
VWDRTFGGNKEDFAYDIGQTTDGGYIVAGYTLPYQQDETAAYVLKLSPNGELLNGGINFYPSREATINITSHSNIVSLGEPILISVRLVNIGYMIWTMDIFRCGAHAYNERGEQIVEDLEGSGFQLPYDLAYGDEAYLEISIPTGIGTQLPSVGNFQIGLDMIQEGVGWFNNEVRFGCQITNK